MHSFLVSSPPQIKSGPDVLEVSPDPSVGIDEVRRIIAFLSRKPLQSAENTVIIHQAEKLTLPAQHALLKTLEEPPGNSRIYLVTGYPDQLIPTILSRVQSDHVSMHRYIDTSALDKSRELFDRLLSAERVGERLKLITESGFTRESALEFLDHLEHILHSEINSPSSNSGKIDHRLYSLITDTRRYLKANANLRLVLDHFALNFKAM